MFASDWAVGCGIVDCRHSASPGGVIGVDDFVFRRRRMPLLSCFVGRSSSGRQVNAGKRFGGRSVSVHGGKRENENAQIFTQEEPGMFGRVLPLRMY